MGWLVGGLVDGWVHGWVGDGPAAAGRVTTAWAQHPARHGLWHAVASPFPACRIQVRVADHSTGAQHARRVGSMSGPDGHVR